MCFCVKGSIHSRRLSLLRLSLPTDNSTRKKSFPTEGRGNSGASGMESTRGFTSGNITSCCRFVGDLQQCVFVTWTCRRLCCLFGRLIALWGKRKSMVRARIEMRQCRWIGLSRRRWGETVARLPSRIIFVELQRQYIQNHENCTEDSLKRQIFFLFIEIATF